LSRWRKRIFASAEVGALDPRHELGRRGEDAAARHLRKLGWKVLYRNFRAPEGGEVDLVCRDGDTLVFAEVKTRARTSEISRPADNVTDEKERLVARGALAWLRLLGDPDIEFRFDIIEVILPPDQAAEITVNEAAFTLPKGWRY
jgi:putative endonuclease